MTTRKQFPVLARARKISDNPDLDVLTIRKYLGVPLANEIRHWMAEQQPWQPLCIDFEGVRAVTTSVAEELGPLLMQTVQQNPTLEHRYPIFRMHSPEPAYTFARAFANFNNTGLALVPEPEELDGPTIAIAVHNKHSVVVLGQLSTQMLQILALAMEYARQGEPLTSEGLTDLDFLTQVGPAARSKRLTELYSRRLLAFHENPANPKERLFILPWML